MAEHLAEPDVCGEAVKQKSQVNRRPLFSASLDGRKELTYCARHFCHIKKNSL